MSSSPQKDVGATAPRKKIVVRRGSRSASSAPTGGDNNNNNNNNAATPNKQPPTTPPPPPPPPPSSQPPSQQAKPKIQPPPQKQEQQERQPLDRMLFGSIHFSAPTFANNVTNRVLFPYLMTRRTGPDSGVDVKPTSESTDTEDFRDIANRLTVTLESAIAEMERVRVEEAEVLRTHEVRCRRVEIREKRQLAAIRLGLEATTARLYEYENRVCNALAATAGIEQHLSQSNARVLRGKSVSQLLRYFKMLTQMNHGELSTLLKNLTKARTEQRERMTAQWEAGNVSAFDPMYYGADPTRAAGDKDVDVTAERDEPDEKERGDIDGAEEDAEGEVSAAKKGAPATRDKMHRLEAAAVAMGLDRVFALRGCTEAQVEWCQKLLHLRDELQGTVAGTANIDLYVDWLRQELVNDTFHLVERFNEFYRDHREASVHQTYGRAVLKTLELVSRLYTTLTPNHDTLLSVFYSRTINELGVTLFSEYSPKPMPAQPPLQTPAQPGAMRHFTTTTLPELKRTFEFLLSRARRDVIIVETIFGTTNSARQQLLAKITEGVVKPLVTQQLKLAEFFERDTLEAEGRLSPRSKRRAAARVADAIAFKHNIESRLFSFFQSYVEELRGIFDRGEVDFLNKYIGTIFTGRTAYAEGRTELELLRRYHTLLEEQYTRDLHPIPEEFFDLCEGHMRKTKELIERLTEVTARVRAYALPKDAASYTIELVKLSVENMGRFLDEELRKTVESIRADRDNWRVRPKSEEELLRPSRPESQQCGLRMLLFVQSSLMSLGDAIAASCHTYIQNDGRLTTAIEETKESAFEALDERAETLLNLCASAIIVRSLSILQHYQGRNDYIPKVPKEAELEMLALPCTRACTLFCHYVTRQFDEAKEFIRLSNGQVPQRQTASQMATDANLRTAAAVLPTSMQNEQGKTANAFNTDVTEAVRARARTMNLQQLLYGDGGPSSFVRTIGVCLYRGIAAHVKAFVVSDRGALIYKQDVTAFTEAMGPIIRTPGLGGAVVEVLFRLLKETSGLLLMPWDHIKGVRETGLLRLMSSEEKVQFIKMREDLREGFKKIAA